MICPQCKAEYRQGFTVCADCEVALVAALSPGSMVHLEASEPGEPRGPGERAENPICTFWKGDDPRIHVELCEILDRAGIPHKTLRRSDHLFNLNSRSAFQLGIPFSQFEKGEALVQEAYGSEEDYATEKESSLLALPEGGGEEVTPRNWDPDNWDPAEATVEVWPGELDLAEMLTASLRENQIHSCTKLESGKEKVYVLAEDEARAREIVREVTEATPPQ